MATGQRRGSMAWCVGILTCIATVTSITWFTALISAHHQEGVLTIDSHGRPSLLGQEESISESNANIHDADSLRRERVERSGENFRIKSITLGDEATGEMQIKKSARCNIRNNTDFQFGDAVKWGPHNKQNSAEACCQACREYKPYAGGKPCKYWVWCGDKERCGGEFRDCWLKTTVHMAQAKPAQGPQIKYTAGILPEFDAEDVDDSVNSGTDRTFHVVVTAQGTPTHWQARVAYYWYKKTQRDCLKEKVCHMGGYTRILHSGEPDDLMQEIPTVVVRPLENKDIKGYVVLNRPWAFVQWLRNSTIKENYVLMSEPDHLWMKPMPNIMKGEKPAAFPFFYIEPSRASYTGFVQRFTGPLTQQQLEEIPPIGNAPTMLGYSDMKNLGEIWMNTTHAIFDDDEVREAWNWVLEMWGFAISTYKAGLGPVGLHWKMMCQPPYDIEPPSGPEHYIMHFTYGNDYALDGKPMFGKMGEWRFDKRTYAQDPIPRNLEKPPKGVENNYVHRLIDMLNEATEMIPGWDEYVKKGVAYEHWDGKTFKN